MDKYIYNDHQATVQVVTHNELVDKLISRNPYSISQSIEPLIAPDLLRLVNEGRLTADGMVPFKLGDDRAEVSSITFKADLNLLPRHYHKLYPDVHLNADSSLFDRTPPELRAHHASTVLVHNHPTLDGASFVAPEDVVFDALRVENVPIAQFMPILLQHPDLDLFETKTLFQMLDVYNRQTDAVNERVGDDPLMPMVQEVVRAADVAGDEDESWRTNLRLRYGAEYWLAKKGYIQTRPQCFVCGFDAGDPLIKDKMLETVRHFNALFHHSDKKDFAYAATDMDGGIYVMAHTDSPVMMNNIHKHCIKFKELLVMTEEPFFDLGAVRGMQAVLKCGDKEVSCRMYNNPLMDTDRVDELIQYRADSKYVYPFMQAPQDAIPVYIDQMLNVYKDVKPEILSMQPIDKPLEERYHRKEETRPLMFRPTAQGAWFYQTGGNWCAWLGNDRKIHTLGQPPGVKSQRRINEIAASQNIILGGRMLLKPLGELGSRTYIKEGTGNIIDVDLELCTDGKVHTVKGRQLVDMNGWQDVTGRITDASVNVLNPQRMTIGYKVDGEPQIPKELGPFFRKLYNSAVAHGKGDEYTRQLAHQYFKDELLQGQEVGQSKGFKR